MVDFWGYFLIPILCLTIHMLYIPSLIKTLITNCQRYFRSGAFVPCEVVFIILSLDRIIMNCDWGNVFVSLEMYNIFKVCFIDFVCTNPKD